jgi:IgA Peptidase M64
VSSTKLAQSTVTEIQRTGPSKNRIDVVFLGDGYTAAEQEAYLAQVRARWAQLSAISPHSRYKNFFNVWAVNVVSPDSGVDNDPSLGIDRDTALDSYFFCSGIERLLCVATAKAHAYVDGSPIGQWDDRTVVDLSELELTNGARLAVEMSQATTWVRDPAILEKLRGRREWTIVAAD